MTTEPLTLPRLVEEISEAHCHIEVSIWNGEYRECVTAIYSPASTSNKLRGLLRKWEQMLP